MSQPTTPIGLPSGSEVFLVIRTPENVPDGKQPSKGDAQDRRVGPPPGKVSVEPELDGDVLMDEILQIPKVLQSIVFEYADDVADVEFAQACDQAKIGVEMQQRLLDSISRKDGKTFISMPSFAADPAFKAAYCKVHGAYHQLLKAKYSPVFELRQQVTYPLDDNKRPIQKDSEFAATLTKQLKPQILVIDGALRHGDWLGLDDVHELRRVAVTDGIDASEGKTGFRLMSWVEILSTPDPTGTVKFCERLSLQGPKDVFTGWLPIAPFVRPYSEQALHAPFTPDSEYDELIEAEKRAQEKEQQLAMDQELHDGEQAGGGDGRCCVVS